MVGRLFIIGQMFLFSACSMDAGISAIGSTMTSDVPSVSSQSVNSDFISGEIVTTTNGVVVKGTFDEVSERKTLSDGTTFDGVFYE